MKTPNIILTPKNETSIRGEGNYLPVVVQQYYGCTNCDWKGSLCPSGFKKKKDVYSAKGSQKNKPYTMYPICPSRMVFIRSLLDPKKKYYDLKDYRHDIKLALEDRDYMKYRGEIREIEDKLKILEEDEENNKETISKLKKRRNFLYKRKDFLLTHLSKYDDKHMDRIAPRKLEITEEKKLTFQQVHQIVREGEVLEEQKKRKEVIIDAEEE